MKRDAYDLIVIGAGAAGLTAATTAAALGKSVLLLEYSDRVGGTTAISGGMVWIPANYKMRQAGISDSLEAARDYLRRLVPGCDQDRRMSAFLARGDEAIRFLDKHTAVKLRPVSRYPDYYPELPGATAGGRVLEAVPFDGLALGDDFALLRDPLPEFMLFGGMMVSRDDLPVLRRVGHSPRAMWHTAKLVARYALQRLRAHRGTVLVLGNALAARLLKSARDLGVEIVPKASVTGLDTRDGRVIGVRVEHEARTRSVRVNDGVVLATGGLSHHPDLRQDYVPAAAGHLSAAVSSGAARGGVHLALDVGAQRSAPSSSLRDALAFWVPVSEFKRADRHSAVFPHGVTDRAKPGLIAVNREGRRFVNEAVSYHEFVRAQLCDPQRAIPAWLICDRRFLWKYGLGRLQPFTLSIRKELASGYLKRSATLEGLAEAIGVPADAFCQTVRTFNISAADGLDPEFDRGGNIYQRHGGDSDHRPNPCVAPIEHSPFYAVAVRPGDLGMAAGLITDENARVLSVNGSAIEGLYACGNDMHSIMNGAYPGPGITLGPAIVFGYLAARHACGDDSRGPLGSPAGTRAVGP
ncbi:MAG: FAD-dependent oxidoreductase [Burkholderiales bacterium]|nr:FAD-dependent oxidoreductase [Burkholderiales bacterium]